jgi:hypothetical protein
MLRLKFLLDKLVAFKEDMPRIKAIIGSLNDITTGDKLKVVGKIGFAAG